MIKFLILFFIALEAGLILTSVAVFGLGYTLLWLILAAVAGMALLATRGIAAWQRVQTQPIKGFEGLIGGLSLFGAGLLLIFPGFLTDFMALILILPLTRKMVLSPLTGRIESFTGPLASMRAQAARARATHSQSRRSGTTIEGQAKRLEDDKQD